MRVLPPRRQAVHQTTFRHPLNPPSVTSVTAVRCFPPDACFSRPEANLSTREPSAVQSQSPKFPLCGLRDLCAMLFFYPGERH
jgi:hypothetical protein